MEHKYIKQTMCNPEVLKSRGSVDDLRIRHRFRANQRFCPGMMQEQTNALDCTAFRRYPPPTSQSLPRELLSGHLTGRKFPPLISRYFDLAMIVAIRTQAFIDSFMQEE
jgi:hypothetical protein